MTLEENVRAIIESCFSQTKSELQDVAVKRILEVVSADAVFSGYEWHDSSEFPEEHSVGLNDTFSCSVLCKCKNEGWMISYTRNGAWEEINSMGDEVERWAYLE